MTEKIENKNLPKDLLIKKLSEFGEDFKYHHKNYEAVSISAIRHTGGVLDFGNLVFHFPQAFGFCYGVDKAIDMVFETCERFVGERIFLTDQLIHNPYINGKLKEKGVRYLKRDRRHLLICDELKSGDIVVVSAFGTDFRDIQNLKSKSVTIVDSTCGAIINVWKRVEGYAKKGFITIMHGKLNHEETRATVSQAVKEGGAYIIIENIKEAEELARVIRGEIKEEDFIKKYPQAVPENFSFNSADCKMGMANQTTMLKGESLRIQELLQKAFQDHFGEDAAALRFKSFDTICGATQDRQDALRNLLTKSLDLLIIVGGFNSSNTSHLAEISARMPENGSVPFYHIESAGDIISQNKIRHRNPLSGQIENTERWLKNQTQHVGITSGASTPDVTLLEIIQRLAGLLDKNSSSKS
ncbi:MAG: 4-hydroxy-3-methylbut-2-enyl diphosphate reductase [Candidatus Omnitrophica bacterium CG1_02_46_14]|nr:MAG: 4-hydroxy-3-methylbut-2-enyl diphosphate reductase [Candidatus Omnitrophica bacterium CG1_02_46_14]